MVAELVVLFVLTMINYIKKQNYLEAGVDLQQHLTSLKVLIKDLM